MRPGGACLHGANERRIVRSVSPKSRAPPGQSAMWSFAQSCAACFQGAVQFERSEDSAYAQWHGASSVEAVAQRPSWTCTFSLVVVFVKSIHIFVEASGSVDPIPVSGRSLSAIIVFTNRRGMRNGAGARSG